MKQGLYTIYDLVAREGGPLFSAKSDDTAIRKTVKMMIEHRLDVQDYELRKIGQLDFESLVFDDIIEGTGVLDFHISYYKKIESGNYPGLELKECER